MVEDTLLNTILSLFDTKCLKNDKFGKPLICSFLKYSRICINLVYFLDKLILVLAIGE